MALSGDPVFGHEIPTEGRTPTEVVGAIMEMLPIAA
jgi:hypothetical protein